MVLSWNNLSLSVGRQQQTVVWGLEQLPARGRISYFTHGAKSSHKHRIQQPKAENFISDWEVFYVKLFLLLTVCSKTDRLQDSVWQHLFISRCQLEGGGGETSEEERRNRVKRRCGWSEILTWRPATRKARTVCVYNRWDIPLALNHISDHPQQQISEIHLTSDWSECWCFHHIGFNYMSHSA